MCVAGGWFLHLPLSSGFFLPHICESSWTLFYLLFVCSSSCRFQELFSHISPHPIPFHSIYQVVLAQQLERRKKWSQIFCVSLLSFFPLV